MGCGWGREHWVRWCDRNSVNQSTDIPRQKPNVRTAATMFPSPSSMTRIMSGRAAPPEWGSWFRRRRKRWWDGGGERAAKQASTKRAHLTGGGWGVGGWVDGWVEMLSRSLEVGWMGKKDSPAKRLRAGFKPPGALHHCGRRCCCCRRRLGAGGGDGAGAWGGLLGGAAAVVVCIDRRRRGLHFSSEGVKGAPRVVWTGWIDLGLTA